jgi:hypothetical protein
VPDDFSETVTVYSALASEPTTGPTGLYFSNTGSAHPYNNVLHFTGSDADGYLVVRSKGSDPSFVPVDGTAYTVGTVTGGEIIYAGSLTTVTDLSATALTNYNYAIYPYKGGGIAANYLTSSPVTAVINNRMSNDYAMSTITKSSSAGLADVDVNVTFVNGVVSGGTTMTATKTKDSYPENFLAGLPSGLHSVKKLYYTVSSSAASPGSYVIVLDYSELNMTDVEWTDAHVLKRSNASSNWEDITAKVIDRKTDGLTGKLTISNLNTFSQFAIGSTEALLPLTWMDFSARIEGEAVALEWKTASEQNTKDFVVQHSTNGLDWKSTGTVPAAGNSTSMRKYRFVHQSPVSGTNYYRLLQRDIDNNYQYSNVQTVRFSSNTERMLILGNPVVNGILEVSVHEKTNISLKSMNGTVLLRQQLAPGKNQIDIHHLAAGTYILIADQELAKLVVNAK